MTTEKLHAMQIQEKIVSSFQDASDYLNFMRSEDNNAGVWASANHVEIENETEYAEVVARIQEDFELVALARIEADIKGYGFDQDDAYLPWFGGASQDEIAAIAETNYDRARAEIAAHGTLF